MAFPSELPAMRRQTVPPPHPIATALAWAGMSYAIATALLMALLPHAMSRYTLSSTGPGSITLGVVVSASILPALIIGLMARRAPAVWSAPRVALPYLAMLAVVGGLLVADLRTDWFLESLALAAR
ncbi:MAG TPA: hypothetical protein VJR58_25515 [Vineibacter sp.]|nr:hypothetical protein [Vineibacter sp.]